MDNSAIVPHRQVLPAPKFISCRIIDGEKLPCDAYGKAIAVTDTAHHVDYATAAARVWPVGFVIGDGRAGVDLDGAVLPDGSFTPFGQWVANALVGAYMEISQSGRGLHIIGRADLPPGHATRVKGWPLEVYSEKRYFQLGKALGGSIDHDITAPLLEVMRHCGLRTEAATPASVLVEAGRDPAWCGPEDDAELIRIMCAQGRRTGAQMFNGTVTVAELWNVDQAALGRAYPSPGRAFDYSAAEAALMWHLSYFTGKDQPRMVRLFEAWPGYRREKHEARAGELVGRLLVKAAANPGVYRNSRYAPAVAAVGDVPALGGAPEAPAAVGGELSELVFHLPSGQVYHVPEGKFWPTASVDARLPPIDVGNSAGGMPGKTIKPSRWLAQNAAVHDMTWAPGMPRMIRGYSLRDGVWRDAPGRCILNTYEPPELPMPRNMGVDRWLKHIAKIYPDDCEILLDWMSFVAQNPGIKVNWAIVLSGAQGIGKDFILDPLRRAVGKFSNATPEMIIKSEFNSYLKTRVLIINEAKDTGGENKFQFYEKTKTIITSPPDVHVINEKFGRPYEIPNLNGTVITTNHGVGGMYLPADDRRHHVAHSECTKADFSTSYWDDLWGWMRTSGAVEDCAAWLLARDVSRFNPKIPPERNAAFWQMVNSGQSAEANSLADVIEHIADETFTLDQVAMVAEMECQMRELAQWVRDPRNATKVVRALSDVGVVKHHNPGEPRRGRWLVNGKRLVLYKRQSGS